MKKPRIGTWLRARLRRQPKLATGGYVAAPKPGEQPIILEGCRRWPTGMGTPAALPDYVTVQMRGYTEMTAEERRQFLNAVNAVMGRSASHH